MMDDVIVDVVVDVFFVFGFLLFDVDSFLMSFSPIFL